jgi:hypothetical protein
MKKYLSLILVLNLAILANLKAKAEIIKAGVSQSTPIPIIAEWPINEGTQVGEHFSARIVEDISSETGEVFIPKNSRVIGIVVNVDPAKSFNRNGKVDIQFTKILFPDNVTSIDILADGSMKASSGSKAQQVVDALAKTTGGAVLGAIAGLKFGGIIGTGSSSASNLAIGAMTGASLSLISFIAKKGNQVEINPGLPMVLNINQMQKQEYSLQQMISQDDKVKAIILSYNDKKIEIEIENQLKHSIPLTNLKIVDGLGYTMKPNIPLNYHDTKAIPAKSVSTYEFEFTPSTKNGKFWLVLTDSFNKQEYFRKEITSN